MRSTVLFIILGTGLLFSIYGMVNARPKLFYTVANKRQVGNVDLMVNDGRFYWISSAWGSFFKYDPKKGNFTRKIFKGGANIEGVMSMEVVEGRVWVGLFTLGVGMYNSETDDFTYYNQKDGIASYKAGNKDICRITAIAYDKHTNKVWLGSLKDAGVTVYNMVTKKWTILDDPAFKSLDVSSIAVSKEYVVIAASGRKGVYYLDKIKNEWNYCGELPFATGVVGRLTDLYIDEKFITFLVIDQRSVVQYNIDTKQYSIFYRFEENIKPQGMTKYKDYLIFSTNHGVIFYNIKNKKMKAFNRAYGLVSNWTNSVYIEGDDMWVLTQEGISKAKIQDVLKELTEID